MAVVREGKEIRLPLRPNRIAALRCWPHDSHDITQPMPKKKSPTRCFRHAFVDHMLERGGWPDDAHLVDALRSSDKPAKTDSLSALRGGRGAPHYYCFNLVSLFLDPPDRHFAQAERATKDFLRDRGFESTEGVPIDSILSHLCEPEYTDDRSETQKKKTPRDWIKHGLKALADLSVGNFVRSHVLGRAHQASVGEAVSWIFVRIAQLRHKNGQDMTPDQCKQAAEPIFSMSYDAYVQQVTRWAEFNPWIVTGAHAGPRSHHGVSIALPLSAKAYEQVRTGVKRTSRVTSSDLSVPSNHIVLEAVAENPTFVNHRSEPTRTMMMAIAAQLGALTRMNPHRETVYRLLAPEGTPENRARMAAQGFRALATQCPETGVGLWERVMNLETHEGMTPIEQLVLRQVADLCPSAPKII